MELNAIQVYERVLKVANIFLKNASHLTIDGLKELDPTVEQLAKDLRMLAHIVKALAGDSYDDENMAINAFQCCIIMERIAKCVELEDDAELFSLVQSLEKHVTVPLNLEVVK